LTNSTSHEINLDIKRSENFCPKFTSTFPNATKGHLTVLNASIQPNITMTKTASGS